MRNEKRALKSMCKVVNESLKLRVMLFFRYEPNDNFKINDIR